jgi:hypothetical protein
MGLHDLFGHLKHKLWPKEGSGVKLVVWFPTTKSQESPRFPYVQMTCDIPLESSQWLLQLCFKPHLNQRFEHKVMGPQSRRSPNFGILGLPLGNLRTKSHLDVGLVKRHIVYYRREGGGFPQVRAWWVLWVRICLWLVLAPKVLQLCINHLLLVLCKFVWVVDVCHSS